MSRARDLADYVSTGVTSAELDKLDGLTATTDELNLVDGSVTGPLSHRNMIINGNFQVNQRGQTSGAVAVDTVTYYTVDRWKLATASDTISWSDSGGIRTVTIPSGDFLTQVIEGLNIISATYVISWVGTATCTVDTVSKSSGDTFSLTAGSNCTVSFTNGTVSQVMVERGSTATPFEHLSYGEELQRCQRYFEVLRVYGCQTDTMYAGYRYYNGYNWRTLKRASPTTTIEAEFSTFPSGSTTSTAVSIADAHIVAFQDNSATATLLGVEFHGKAEL